MTEAGIARYRTYSLYCGPLASWQT